MAEVHSDLNIPFIAARACVRPTSITHTLTTLVFRRGPTGLPIGKGDRLEAFRTQIAAGGIAPKRRRYERAFQAP